MNKAGITIPNELLEFNSAEHKFTVNGIKLPSVTQLMTPLTEELYDGIPKDILAKAAERGSMVHKAIEYNLKYGIDDIADEYRNYYDAYLKWKSEYNISIVHSELKLYHRVMMYAGIIDALAWVDGKLTLIDFKCTAEITDMTCGVQLEAYKQALKSHNIDVESKQIIQLTKQGEFNVHEYPLEDIERWEVFSSLKFVYDYIQKSN